MKIQAETMKRIFADMTAMWNAVPKAKQDEMREALASGNITITNLGWQLYHLAFADRNYDNSHPRYQTRARILPLAPFPMYPDGANDDHMATMFKRFELPPVTPPAVSCCINNGCGLKFDPTVPETRSLETLKPFAMLYCPKHRIPATPPVVFVNIPPAVCRHCGKTLTNFHGPFARCAGGKTQFEPQLTEPEQTPDETDFAGALDAIETRERITCDQCELLGINGVCCHEIGCPNMGARWDAENREWIKQRKCFECGCTVDKDDPCCSAPFEDDEPEPEDDEEEEEEEEDALRSTVDTPEMHDTVLSEARDTLERHNLTATFEHGQWWIEDKEDGAQWSVVDCETATGEEYFDFEQVTQGDED